MNRALRLAGIFSLLLWLAQPVPATAAGLFPDHAQWFNVSRPLDNADLAGRVVLLDFFTPGCINCIHTLPELKRLQAEFGGRLLIVGVNSPKFTASAKRPSIEGFIARYHLSYPIVTDRGMSLWRLFNVYAWPTQILLGPDLQPVASFVGEGHYAAIRAAIIETLARTSSSARPAPTALPLSSTAPHHPGLLQPGKVAVSGPWVAVSDTGHDRVLLFDRHGKLIRRIGSGLPGHADGAPGQARFRGAQGLAFLGSSLYVADTGNHLIRRIALPSGEVTTVAGNGRRAYVARGMHPALDVALDSPWGLEAVGDTLYIAMAGDHRVWRLDLARGQIGPYAGSGREGLSKGPLTRARLAQPSGLAYHDGTLYVANPESSSVSAIDLAAGRVHTLIGLGLFEFGMRDGPSPQALMQHDEGLAWLGGRLYIADTFNNAIRVYDPRSQRVSTLTRQLHQPGGLAAFGPHTLLVADTNANRLVRIDTRSGKLSLWPLAGL